MTRTIARIALVAIAVAALAAGAVRGFALTDTATDIVLGNDADGHCVVTSKADEIKAKKGHKISWRIDNRCKKGGRPELVTIGNFRTAADSTRSDCLRATEGAVWPFRESENAIRSRRHSTRIELHVKKPAQLPPVYNFDICTGGEQANRKSDPRLLIED